MRAFRRWPVVAAAAWGALWCAACSRDDPPTPAASDFTRLDEPAAVAADADPRTSADEESRSGTDEAPRTSTDELQQSPPASSADIDPRLPAEVETIYRPSDQRPRYDDARVAQLGIARYESKRLRLYTDIAPEIAKTLPPLFDQAYDAWSDYFGPLPPDREGTEFQVTGFIMQERDRFAAAGMFPEQAQALLVHGIHRRNEFWMDAQEYDDYRRHLMIHEGTHCFMTVMPGAPLPVWYLEGMAELFGAHTLDAEGRATFRVMPETPGNYVGFGRVEMIHQAIQDGKYRSAQGVTELSVEEFAASRTDPYAWTWALCKFLDTHPRYRERFRELARRLDGNEFARGMQSSFAPDLPVLWVEWELFARNLVYGYDIERAAIDFRRGEPLPEGGSIAADIRADKGWQSSGVWVEAGRAYDISASGEVSLAQTPRPWISQPPGVSIRYASGKPIGRLVAGVQSETPPDENGVGALWHVIDVGAAAIVTPAVDGTLYFRVNDFWNEVADNQGEYRVTVRPGR